MDSIIPLIVIGTSLWVLFDAYSIGARKGKIEGMGNMGPWSWFFGCLLLWIVCFPFYLAKRGQFKQANSKPAENRNNASGTSADSIEQLEKISALREKGALTEEEFNAKKRELLAQGS